MKPILVTCYVDPDLDGVAGAIAYAEYLNKTGRPAEAGIFGEPHDEAKFILNEYQIPYPKKLESTNGYDQIILVDSSDLVGLEGNVPPEKVIEIIDHRKINEAEKFPNAKVQIELVGAAVTLITEKFMDANLEVSETSALLLYGAIVSNTLNFHSSTNTERDVKAADWANQTAKIDDNFIKRLFVAKSDLSGSKLAGRIIGDFARFEFGTKKVSITQIEVLGAVDLVNSRAEEIAEILAKLKAEYELDYIFLTAIDLDLYVNALYCDDSALQPILEKALNISFIGNVARREELIMRKQIVPLLKEVLVDN